jgi:hypothetical protein
VYRNQGNQVTSEVNISKTTSLALLVHRYFNIYLQAYITDADTEKTALVDIISGGGNSTMDSVVNHNGIAVVRSGEMNSTCAAIESTITRTPQSMESVVPFNWFSISNLDSLCIQCSLCLQSHEAVE